MASRARTLRLVVPALLAAAIITVALTIKSAADGTYEVTALFDDVKGLVPGNEVQAGGARIGTVGDIELDGDGYPRVTLEIDDDFQLRQGATADLRLFSLANQLGRYVLLTQGRGPVLGDGATIGLARTDQPVELDDVLRTLDPATRADVRGVLRKLNEATAGRGHDLAVAAEHAAPSINEFANLLEDVNADEHALRAVLREGRVALRAITRDPGAAGDFVDRLGGLLQTTAHRQAEISASLERLPAGLRSTRLALERLDRSIPELRTLVRTARPATRELIPTARELRRTAAVLPPALASIRRLIAQSPAHLTRLQPLLRTAGPSLERVDSVLCLANPILDEVRVFTPSLIQGVVEFGDLLRSYDANGHVAMVGVIEREPPTNPVGPDTPGPGSVEPPFFRYPGIAYPVLQPWRDFPETFLTDRDIGGCPQ